MDKIKQIWKEFWADVNSWEWIELFCLLCYILMGIIVLFG